MEGKLILFVMLIACTYAQRPMYAGTSVKGVPELASRFRKPADDVNVLNRAAVEEDRVLAEPIPVDALGDHKLVQRVNTWPKENRPFWLINAEQIERHRNTRPGVGIIRSTGATTNTENQAQKAAVQLEQQRDTGVDQEQDMSNQQQRRLRPSDIGSRSGDGHGRGSRALFTPEEVLWDSRASRIRNKSH